MQFSRWGAFVYRFRRPVALIALVLGLLALPLAAQTAGELSSGGWLDRDAESTTVANRLAAEFRAGRSDLIVLFRSTDGTNVTSPEVQAAIATSLTEVREDPRVTGTIGYAETQDERFVGADGTATYVVVQLDLSNEESVAAVEPLREKIQPGPGLSFQLTGYGPVTKDSAEQSEADLQRAETVSLPIAAFILILVFASLIAAGMPLLVAGLAIPSSLAIIYLVAQQMEMSIFVLNIATMLGLALAIDYSLFMVSRFREELGKGRTVGDAVERAMATSGKAVAFSGMAVAIGLSGLLVFEAPALRSIGLAGSIVVFCSVLYSLTFLPAVLGMLGHRVNSLTFQGLARRIRPVRAAAAPRPSRWEGVARWVMRRPILVLVPTLAFLLALGAPFLRLQQGVPGAEIYPAGLESRDAYVALQTEFPRGETTPIVVLADVEGSPARADNALALARYAVVLGELEGVSRVEGPFSLTDPATGAAMSPESIAQLWSTPRDQLPAEVAAGLDRLEAAYIRGSTVRFDAISPIDASQPAASAMIPVVRTLDAGPGITTQVGGTAALGHDFLVSQAERAPFAVAIPLVASAFVLFLLFGSVVLPIKAVLMTLLSITASFGALVWIFQEGNLVERPRLRSARLHHRRQPDHHVLRAVRAVDGLRGPPPLPDPGGLSTNRRQHLLGRRGPRQDRRHDHRGRGRDDQCLRSARSRRGHHDQEHRRRYGDRGVHRRDDHPRAPGPGDDATHGRLELVGTRPAQAILRPARLQSRRGRGRRGREPAGRRPVDGPGEVVD